jgi:DNA-binding response OmpR family regulator
MAKERILAIEDDADVAELLIMFFSSQGYEIFHADNGREGIALARAKLPNLILLDIMLPDMDGFDICKELRSKNLTKYIPTIFLTQRNARADKVEGLQLGADDYITKPFDVEELRIRVKKSIQNATRDHLHEEVTGLPTGPLVEDVFLHFQQSSETWHRVEVNLAGFEAFRDAYGFLTSNDALHLAAKILSDALSRHGTDDDFVGVVERVNFVFFTFSPNVDTILMEANREFTERSLALYKYTDADQGYIVLNEGSPDERHVPLMHLTAKTEKF